MKNVVFVQMQLQNGDPLLHLALMRCLGAHTLGFTSEHV
jgi:hypothetical protein